ncbi:MAG: chromate resistance protein ChrB domain-containing protein [Vulcanimicrobiaceae bacterium]
MTDAMPNSMPWIVLSYSLPQGNRASLRVSFWRRLRKIGALSPKVGVHVLPWSDDNVEAFDWMAQEAKHAGGDALVMHVERFEGLPDKAMIAAFNAARAENYAELEADLSDLEQHIRVQASDVEEYRALHEPFVRLRRRIEEILAIDFFDSDEGQRLGTRIRAIEAHLRPPKPEDTMGTTREQYVGRTWVTRPRPFVDRLGCVWLICRYIDKDARIRYDTNVGPGEISFDMPDAAFGHRGEDCTFETMLKAFEVGDAPVLRLAQIVHAIDVRDDRFDAPEALGLEAILRGWQRSNLPDDEMERRGLALFDALYETFQSTVRQ